MAESSGTTEPTTHTTRRTIVAVAGTAGLAAALAACGGSDSDSSSSSSSSSASSTAGPTGPTAPPSPPSPPAGQSSTTGGGASSAELAKTSEIPEGGGKIFADKHVVVTQPEAGTFKAFSAICTHAGCPVSQIKDGTIDCPCHGSKFRIEDGSVKHGPATKPLAPKKINVAGGTIKLV
jgi:Rieske Fe-S protein